MSGSDKRGSFSFLNGVLVFLAGRKSLQALKRRAQPDQPSIQARSNSALTSRQAGQEVMLVDEIDCRAELGRLVVALNCQVASREEDSMADRDLELNSLR